ncbi:hypothetical protein KBC04_04740 [Candidatus Babeliales bacterium]|nr:hypothetical protein [Candidatus Babeliales bacterium]MBP9844127.1 hypothetical protein [Candidatus Babeliales bacterium]
MKLKQLILASLMLPTMSSLQSVADVATLNNSAATLLAAQNALTNLIGGGSNSYSNEGLGTIQTTITNNCPTIMYIVLLDANNNQINNYIPLAGKTYTYIPNNIYAIKVVDVNKKELVGSTPIQTNTPYSVTHIGNKWEVTKLDVSTQYSYKNTTNIPLIVKITTNNIERQEQINPGSSLVQTMNPSTALARKLFISNGNFSVKYSPLISVEVHADLSPISLQTIDNASYVITINNNQLVCTKTADTGNTITNSTGWQMLISSTTSKNIGQETALNNGNYFQPSPGTNWITIVPLIKNKSVSLIPAQSSLSISNNKSSLFF